MFKSIKKPAFCDSSGDNIYCNVTIDYFDGELPFVASKHDPEIYGRELYERIKSGEFGEIEPYKEPELSGDDAEKTPDDGTDGVSHD